MRMTVGMLRRIIREEVARENKNPAYTTHAARTLTAALEAAIEAAPAYKDHIKHMRGKEMSGGDYMPREMTKSFVPLLQSAVNLDDDGLVPEKASNFLRAVNNDPEVQRIFDNEELCSKIDWSKVVDELHDKINDMMPLIGSKDGPGAGHVSPFRGFGTRGRGGA